MGEIHAAVIHGHEAAQLFQSMNEDEKEYQTLANTYIAKIRVYTDEKIRNSDHLRVAHKYVLRMLTIAKKTASQAKEIDRLKRRISNITATLLGQKTIEWISGKGNVRKVVFRDAKKKVTNDDVTFRENKKERSYKEARKENNLSKPRKFTTFDAKVNKAPKGRKRVVREPRREKDQVLRPRWGESTSQQNSFGTSSTEFY